MIEIFVPDFSAHLLNAPMTLKFLSTWHELDEEWPIKEQLYAQLLGWA